MSFNLVDLVKGQLGGPALGQLGALLGEDNNKTEAALGAAIPGLLSGLTSSANADGGASLFDAVNKQDDSLLDNIGGLLTGGNSSNVMNQGSSLLGSLLGGGAASGLASAVAGLTGIGGKSSSGLMGMLLPIALGIIKRQIFGGSGGFAQNAGGLLSMLNGQKNNIQAAMPSGFQNQLQSSGFMDQMSNFGGNAAGAVGGAASAVGGAASNAAGAVGNAAGNVADGVGNVAGNVADGVGNVAGNVADGVGNVAGNVGNAAGDVASSGGGFLKKFLPIAAIIAIGAFALKMCTGGVETPDVNVPTVEVPKVEMPSVELPDMPGLPEGMGAELGSSFEGAKNALGSITDVDSAKAALPQLDGLTGMLDKVPESARGGLSGMLGGLTPMLDKVSAIPGVGAVIAPFVEKLQGFM